MLESGCHEPSDIGLLSLPLIIWDDAILQGPPFMVTRMVYQVAGPSRLILSLATAGLTQAGCTIETKEHTKWQHDPFLMP